MTNTTIETATQSPTKAVDVYEIMPLDQLRALVTDRNGRIKRSMLGTPAAAAYQRRTKRAKASKSAPLIEMRRRRI